MTVKMLEEQKIILHQGTYKKTATTAEAVFMITGMTIGAGILGLPYAIAQVGLAVGLLYILVLGIIMLSLQLMIGEVIVRTGENLQLPGLAGKYLGKWAKFLLSLTLVSSSYGALLAYIVGEGESLSAMFGGNPLAWSVIFWSVGSFLIWGGLQRIRKAEKIVSSFVIVLIVCLALFLLPHADASAIWQVKTTNLFLPFGVILFALHGTPAIAEAHALLPGSERRFKKALLLGTLIPILVYMLFAGAVVAVSGLATTEVATIGLGEKFGSSMLFFANLFAVLAMSTAFMGLGTALKETLVWDYKVPKFAAKLLVISLPLALFLVGARNFIVILEVVGGLFIATEGVIMTLVYGRARARGDVKPRFFASHHALAIALPGLLFFSMLLITAIATLVDRFYF